MKRPLTAFVADDELAAREELKYLLSQWPDVQLVGEAANGTTALDRIANLQPDVCFLDIQMPGLTGLELARRIVQCSPKSQVVFATAFDHHALDAFELDAADYVLKPFDAGRLRRALDRASRLGETTADIDTLGRVVVERRGRRYVLEVGDIRFIATETGIVTVVDLEGTRFGSNHTLRELDAQLDAGRFYRCHREAIVPLEHIAEVGPAASGTWRITLDDEAGTVLPVARNRVRGLKDLLGI